MRNQRHLPEDIALPERRDGLAIAQHIGLAADHDEDLVAEISLIEHHFASVQVLARDRIGKENTDLGDVARQENIQAPVGEDPPLAVQAGNLLR